MNRKWVAIGLFVLLVSAAFISLKMAVYPHLDEDQDVALARIKTFLVQNQFNLDEIRPSKPGYTVLASRGACRIRLREISPQGWDVSQMKSIAESDPFIYVYKDREYAEQPVWRTWFDYRVWRSLRYLGIPLDRDLIYGIVIPGDCKGVPVDWEALSVAPSGGA